MIRIRSKKMQTIVKIGLISCYFVIMAVMFFSGRTHTVLIDNNSSTTGEYKALDGCSVTIGDNEPIEFFPGDRDKIRLRGQNHQITVKLFNGEKEITGRITIPLFEDAVLVSIPAFVAKKEAISSFKLYGKTAE